MSRRADFLHCDRMNFEDPQFVERIRRCDADALRDVVESYLPHILNTARASGLAPERAEDVTQATFATFLERASAFEGRSHVRTWLFGILYRKISEARRGLDRERRSDAIDQIMEAALIPEGCGNPLPRLWLSMEARLRSSSRIAWRGRPLSSAWLSSCVRSKSWTRKKFVIFWTYRAPTWECFSTGGAMA